MPGNNIKEPFSLNRTMVDYPTVDGAVATLYVVECAGFHKIGVSTDFARRLRGLDTASPLPVTKVATRTIPASAILHAEAWLHQRFADQRVKGEWFSATKDEIMPTLAEVVRKSHAFDRECRRSYYEWEETTREQRLREALDYFDKNDQRRAAWLRENQDDFLEGRPMTLPPKPKMPEDLDAPHVFAGGA